MNWKGHGRMWLLLDARCLGGNGEEDPILVGSVGSVMETNSLLAEDKNRSSF